MQLSKICIECAGEMAAAELEKTCEGLSRNYAAEYERFMAASLPKVCCPAVRLFPLF